MCLTSNSPSVTSNAFIHSLNSVPPISKPSSPQSVTIPADNSDSFDSTTTTSSSSSLVKPTSDISLIDLSLFFVIVLVTYYGIPPFNSSNQITISEVGYYGWITAIFTGFGILPFLFVKNPNSFWMGISNAIAAGMMMAASYSLASEGFESNQHSGYFGYSASYRVVFGFLLGVLFILLTKHCLSAYEDLNICSLTGSDAKKVFLIMLVMTIHSFSEGIGIGISFGGQNGHFLGKFISLSLACHNIPEGLAIALILRTRNVSYLRTTLLCIFSSIPQPIMAIPAYYFIERFMPILPIGLGFASGAMLYVAMFELIPEAVSDCKWNYTAFGALVSFGIMYSVQEYLHHSVGAL